MNDIMTFYERAGTFQPNPLQQAVWQAYYAAENRPALLMKAGTGAGKTEAILFPALADTRSLRRLLFVLPSKALVEDMGERMRLIGKRLSEAKMRDLAITIDMGGSCRRYSYRNGIEAKRSSTRHLFADDIIITTLDKFLFHVFGYGEATKSYIFPHRMFGNALAKSPLIVFDEAHEYDDLAFSNFIKLLQALYVKGQSLCVMSATMPTASVDFLDVIDGIEGELGLQQQAFQRASMPTPEKRLTLVPVAQSLVDTLRREIEQRYHAGKRIIARVETVKDLLALHAALPHCQPVVYHGRMTTEQRKAVIHTLQTRQQNQQGFFVLATSAIEAGCDFDAHLILTELCQPDSLTQLAGRLNRRGNMPDAELVVVGERLRRHINDDEFSEEEQRDYLDELREMGGHFRPERLARFFKPPTPDWMGDILFDMLWGYVYEADLTAEPLYKRGILVTRSWEPSVTLCAGLDSGNMPRNPIQVGISELVWKSYRPDKELKTEPVEQFMSASRKENRWEWDADIYRNVYKNAGTGEEGRYILEALPPNASLSCYETSLLCVIKPDAVSRYYDETVGYIRLPKLFKSGRKDGFERSVDYQPQIDSKTGCFAIANDYIKRNGRVWYLER